MYFQIVVILLVSWLLILKWRIRYFDKLYEQLKISSPRLPLIGHLYLFRNAVEIMRQLQRLGIEAMQAGGISGLWLGTKLYIHISDPEVANTILKNCLEKDDMMKCFHIATGDGSLFAAVKTWRPRRKYIAPTFKMKNLNRYVENFSKQSDSLVDKINKNIVGTNHYSMGKMYVIYSFSSILESLGINVSTEENYKSDTIITSIEKMLNIITFRLFQPWLYQDFVYNMLPQCHAMKKHLANVNELTDKVIRGRRKNENIIGALKTGTTECNDLKSFIDLMIELPANFSDVAIREESLILIIAGSDTTSFAIGFVTVMLARHPDLQEKVYQELNEVIGEIDRPITAADLPNLKYLSAVIKETLRLYPPLPLIVRKIDKNIELPSGVTLIPGCGAIINIWTINRNPTYWGKDADEFRPERFLESEPRHPAAFTTFSHGPRNCVGYQYAMMSMKTVIAKLISKYRLTPAPDDRLEPLRVKFDVMMRDIDDYRVSFEKRK